MVLVETSFPRGGTVKKSVETTNIVFGARQNKKDNKKSTKKQKKEKSTEDHEEEPQQIEAISADLLNHKTIQEGMILMGTVKFIDPIYMKISLPGRIVGKVIASKISDSYTKMLNIYVESSEKIENFQPLNEMYQIGQIVYAKVIEIKQNENGKLDINLSLKPSDVHSNMHHENIRKGMLFNGAIEEIQEHGYVVESGVKNLRCFLPLEKTKLRYSIGQLVFMKVEKLTQSSNASIAVCKAVIKEANHKIKDLIEPNLDYILPSTIVQFTVAKILKDGLQGTIMNGSFKGYINEHQLNEPLAKPSDFEIHSVLSARILYIMPLTKLIYLSLNLNYTDQEQIYHKGDIIENVKIHRIGTGGIILNLDGECKGLISFKTIKANYVGNYDEDEILAKYAKNTKLKVRVIDFDPMDSLYICSDDPNVVKEKFYTINDLIVGDFVTATIAEKQKNGGYILKVGNLRGFIEPIFLSPTSLHLSENAKIRCRIMATHSDRNIAYFTNRPEYMTKECKLLKQISQAKVKKIFTGTIVKVDPVLMVVKFFNDIKGILYKSKITGFMANEMESFYVGQTMPFRIIRNDNGKISLGLSEDLHKPGDICQATVNSIIENGLDISIDEENNRIKGIVPIRLLSEFPELIGLHQKTYKPNDQLEVACIVKNIFSVRDVDYFRNTKLIHWKQLNAGNIIRGCIKNVENDIVEIYLPLKGFNKFIKVHMEMFLEKFIKNSNISVYPDQIVYVKILSKELVTKHLTISAKLTDVWDCNLITTAEIFAKYLKELNHIKESLRSRDYYIANFKLGEMCSAKIVGYDEETNDCFVELENNIRGTIKGIFMKNNKMPEIGKELKCIILWIDYLNEMVYLSHQPGECEHITEEGVKLSKNLIHKVALNAKILIKTNDLLVCSLKKGQNPLIFIPTHLHYNDFENISVGTEVKEGDFCRLVVIHDEYPIAVFESTWKMWNSGNGNRKRKLSENLENLTNVKKVKKEQPLFTMQKFMSLSSQGSSSTNEVRIPLVGSDEDEALHYSSNIEDNMESKPKAKTEKVKNKDKQSTQLEEKQRKNSTTSNADDNDDADNSTNAKKETQKKTRKRTKSETSSCSKSDLNDDDDGEESLETKRKFIDEFKKTMIEEERKYKEEQKAIKVKPALPGAIGFWSNDLETVINPTKNAEINQVSDDDDEDPEKTIENKKKKKLTPAERFEAARKEEARLREIEERNANLNVKPETADEFDRLVLANPNNSKTWIEYMVFHLTSTEIDKARAVAKKALKSINFREEQELINIWIALLNLELRFGTKETFDDNLKEALTCNDPYKIYTRLIQIFIDAQKTQELTDTIMIMIKKFREKQDMWRIAANAYFEIGLPEKAKQLLQKALASLPERDHINTIVMFANLNYKHGDKETAHTLLEQVLTSYPKRVDVWTQYVDMLIKDQEIESARRTLERAVIQKIPLKKMRTLFKKYLDFEERYGSEENVLKVKEMAANYVKKEIDS